MRNIAICFCVLLAVLMGASLGVAYAKYQVNGSDRNNWGPIHEHKNWPLPDDCGGKRQGQILYSGKKVHAMRGRDGCDFMRGGPDNDLMRGGGEMDTMYGGVGNDRIIGNKGHDHLFGDEGNDYLGTRDGNNEKMHFEETRGASGTDRCWLDSDPDGVKFTDCEYLNGKRNPWGGSDKYINTSEEGYQTDLRGEINRYLSKHGG